MPIESRLTDGIIYTELSGAITFDVVVDYIDFIYSLKDDIDCRYELHDHTKTARLNLTIDDIRNIVTYAGKTSDIFRHSFLAVYATNDLTFGVARMFEAFYEMAKRRIHAEIFRSREAAIQYLTAKKSEYGLNESCATAGEIRLVSCGAAAR